MALFWVQQAATRSGPAISAGWASALAAAGWVLTAAEAWYFNEDHPATPWDENYLWERCDGTGEDPDDDEWPYHD